MSLVFLNEDQVHPWRIWFGQKRFIESRKLQKDENEVSGSKPVVGLRQSHTAVAGIAHLGEIGEQLANIKQCLGMQFLISQSWVSKVLQCRYQIVQLAAEAAVYLRLNVLNGLFQRLGNLFVSLICRR